MSDGDEITAVHVPRHIRYAERVSPIETTEEGLDAMVEELEKHLVIETLRKNDNNITKTANFLKIPVQDYIGLWKKFPQRNYKVKKVSKCYIVTEHYSTKDRDFRNFVIYYYNYSCNHSIKSIININLKN